MDDNLVINKENKYVEFTKNNTEKVRVDISDFVKGKKILNIRVWWYDDKKDEYHPSKKGLAISVDKFDYLKQALLEIEKMLG